MGRSAGEYAVAVRRAVSLCAVSRSSKPLFALGALANDKIDRAQERHSRLGSKFLGFGISSSMP